MDESFDIAVIGAGPAGSAAAWSAAAAGRNVCLLERNEKPGFPVRCGEGIGIRSLTEHSDARPEWIKREITGSVMVAPDGTKVTIADIDKSTILDRERMDYDLSQEAVKAGAQLFVNTPVIEVIRIPGGRYQCRCPQRTVIAKIVIIADGVESRIGRALGWNTCLAPDDIESCAFTRVTSPLIDQDSCVFFVGSGVAPGGYAWIFPRGNEEANVGLGILGTHCAAGKPGKLLQEFINRQLPGCRAGALHCGGVPVTRYIRPLVRDGAMLVGDAARQVNCISGAGIAYSLFAGKIAGGAAAEAIRADGVHYQALTKYEKLWKQRYGKQQERSFALKDFVIHHTDDAFLNRIAATLVKKKSGRIGYLTVFLSTFSRHPLLMFKAFKLFG
ncbi:MAG: NAD(P)/FAD-dependent oxidoreductase [Chitinispirillaceae bacterium]|nr:NAD(P)/FAD-dependent oxidoreductase [Chitinispirillaceae bacterium]